MIKYEEELVEKERLKQVKLAKQIAAGMVFSPSGPKDKSPSTVVSGSRPNQLT